MDVDDVNPMKYPYFYSNEQEIVWTVFEYVSDVWEGFMDKIWYPKVF